MKSLFLLPVIIGAVSALTYGQGRNSKTPNIIQLPKPVTSGSMTVERAIFKRRSIREFSDEPLNYTQLGQLAWSGQGITDSQSGKRAAPSAGALYTMKLYFATDQGLFLYEPLGHTLSQLETRDLRPQLAGATMGQDFVAKAPCDIIIAGSVNQIGRKYGRKARDFALLEAGHIAENILLQAVALNLGSVPVGAIQTSNVQRLCRMPRGLEPFYIIPVGYPLVKSDQQVSPESKGESEPEKEFIGGKALMIIASDKFRDEELFETQKILNENQVKTTIASSTLGDIRGMLGGTAKAEFLLTQASAADYDVVIFVGGTGAREYYENQTAWKIARQAQQNNKLLAAICIAPTILAKAGLLEDKKVTAFPSERVRLLKAKAQYTGADVQKDGNIITASGPQAAKAFAKVIVDALKSR